VADLAATGTGITVSEGGKMMAILYGRSQNNMTLREAIAACQLCFGDAVGLFYSPESCSLGKVTGTSVTDSGNADVNLERVFEARIFNADYELRWLNKRGGNGLAVLLSERAIADYFDKAIDELEAIETQNQTYLLWGEGLSANLQPGWSRLATSRLGKLDVPIGGVSQQGQRVKLKAKEYFQVLNDWYGNVIVAEERLIGLVSFGGK
jgi:CRISPR-associated protein (TIGR03984 family)